MKRPVEPKKPWPPSKPLPPDKQITQGTSQGSIKIDTDYSQSVKSFIESIIDNTSNVQNLDDLSISFSIDTETWYYDEVITSLTASITSHQMIDNPNYEIEYQTYLNKLKYYNQQMKKHKEDMKAWRIKFAKYEIDRDKYELKRQKKKLARLEAKKSKSNEIIGEKNADY